jgi:carbon storage regulator CsrA
MKKDGKILLEDQIIVKVVEIRGKPIRLGIEATDSVLVLREKLAEKAKASRST